MFFARLTRAAGAAALFTLSSAVQAQVTPPPGGWLAQPGGWTKPVKPAAELSQAAPSAQASSTIFSEFKLGALIHDEGPFSSNKEDGVDVNFELLFTSPGFLKWAWEPRPHIGADLNTSGNTSQAYVGLTWDFRFLEYGLFEFSVGGAYHDGTEVTDDRDTKSLGCHLLFRESVALGVRFLERHSLTAYLDHISNASLCDANEGLENVGIRYGYRF